MKKLVGYIPVYEEVRTVNSPSSSSYSGAGPCFCGCIIIIFGVVIYPILALVNNYIVTVTNCYDNTTKTSTHMLGVCGSWTEGPSSYQYVIVQPDNINFYYVSNCIDQPTTIPYNICDSALIKYSITKQNGVGFIIWVIIDGLVFLGFIGAIIFYCKKRAK